MVETIRPDVADTAGTERPVGREQALLPMRGVRW